MGRKPETKVKIFNKGKKNEKRISVKLFPWEELDYVGKIQTAFKAGTAKKVAPKKVAAKNGELEFAM